ncbi:MAG: hypothetical protein II882_02390 [Lachnospiraceae bacterium]|nr:hypothetical protein [Lachnospiraceae bacterium]
MQYSKPFMTIKETVAVTGLSQFYLRQGIKAGTVPYIQSGNRFLINVPMLMDALNRESEAAHGEET